MQNISPMFTTRSNTSKLPFHRTFAVRSAKQKQKWILRLSIGAVLFFLLLARWHSSSSSSSASLQSSHTPNQQQYNSLEVHLRPPATSDARDFKELTFARETKLVAVGDRIPKIVHFVYGLRDPDPTLDLIHYTAIKSAHDVLKPDKIMFHYHYMPVGENFERARPMLSLNQVPMVTNVFDRPVSHYAHRADVVRLQVLEEFGGIYLDLDLISLKPVDHLLDKEFVMAQEGVDGSVGLCNAMIMARSHSRFVQRWYSTYASFDSSDWNYHSVILPGKLAPFFPKEITVLNHTAFFWPLWDSQGLRTLYLEKSYDFSANLGTHIWESAANKNLMKDISETVIMEIDNSLYCQLRPFLLDGREDPRPSSCRILSHTERSDGLVGHWPLTEPLANERKEINPMPAEDESGNDLAGIIRNGEYDSDTEQGGVYLSSDTSYIFLNMPFQTSAKTLTVSWWMKTVGITSPGQMAMVIQTDNGRLCVTTRTVQDNGALSLNLETIRRNDQWEWAPIEELKLRPSPHILDQEYHHYTLVVDSAEVSSKRGEPPIALYMDGHITQSSFDWIYPEYIGSIVRGIWFGSIEPLNDRYQAPWDNTVNLEAYYRDIYVWEQGLSAEEIVDLYTASKPVTVAKSKAATDDKDEGKEEKIVVENNGEQIENEQQKDEEEEEAQEREDEELLWTDDDQMDD